MLFMKSAIMLVGIRPVTEYPTLGLASSIPVMVRMVRSDLNAARVRLNLSAICSLVIGCWAFTISTIWFCLSDSLMTVTPLFYT